MASFSAPGQAQVGQAVSFDGSASSDPQGQTLRYAWSFGDGTQQSGPKVSHSYANEGPYTVQLTVTNTDNLEHSAQRTIQISPAPAASLTLSPQTAQLQPGQAQTFSPTLTNLSDPALRWYVNDLEGGNASVGTVNASGLYTAPNTSGDFTVKAVSQANPAVSASAAVQVRSNIAVSIGGGGPSVLVSNTLDFDADGPVRWRVNGVLGGNSTVGAVSGDGVYTAPVFTGTYTIRAESTQDTSKFAERSVRVDPPNLFFIRTVMAYVYDPVIIGMRLDGLPGAVVEVLEGDTVLGVADAQFTLRYIWSTASRPEGSYTLRARARVTSLGQTADFNSTNTTRIVVYRGGLSRDLQLAPEHNSTNVNPSHNIVATFPTAAIPEAITLVLRRNGNLIPGTVSFSGNAVTLDPSAPLPVGVYEATVSVDTVDGLGNPVTSGTTWTFTVGGP